jgi:hypothetical protein
MKDEAKHHPNVNIKEQSGGKASFSTRWRSYEKSGRRWSQLTLWRLEQSQLGDHPF